MSWREVGFLGTAVTQTLAYPSLGAGNISTTALLDLGDGFTPESIVGFRLVTVQSGVRLMLGIPGGAAQDELPDGVPITAVTNVAASTYNTLLGWTTVMQPVLPTSGSAERTYTVKLGTLPRKLSLAVHNFGTVALDASATQVVTLTPIHHLRIPA
mgnify:CR=1 FL=1